MKRERHSPRRQERWTSWATRLWVSPLHSGALQKVFEFDDPDARIDYPVWSPDGLWVLFDRFRPQGGDIWMMEGFE